MKIWSLRSAWLEWLKNIACTVAVTVSVAAGAVIAASEALQSDPGSAIAVLCGAVGNCRRGSEPAMSGTHEATAAPLRPPGP